MFQFTYKNSGVSVLSHPSGNAKASFDLLKTYGRDVFKDLIDHLDLTYSETENGYVWHNNSVAIRSYCNPFTGLTLDDNGKVPDSRQEHAEDYFYPKGKRSNLMREFNLSRPPEPAYMSYVHIVGDETMVSEVFNYLNNRGSHDGASGTEWIV